MRLLVAGSDSASGGTETAWLSPQYRMIAEPLLMWRNVARRPPCSTGWSGAKTENECMTALFSVRNDSPCYRRHEAIPNPIDCSVNTGLTLARG